jgi:hypothetical protein
MFTIRKDRGKTLITRYQPSRDPHEVTSAQLSIIVTKMSASSKAFCSFEICDK